MGTVSNPFHTYSSSQALFRNPLRGHQWEMLLTEATLPGHLGPGLPEHWAQPLCKGYREQWGELLGSWEGNYSHPH